jgi:hypothetical protein
MNCIFAFFITQDIATYIFYERHLSWKIIKYGKWIREIGANAKTPMKPITRQMLAVLIPYKTLKNDGFFAMKLERICKLELISRTSILDMFDDDPLFSEFSDLKGLARNKQFEQVQRNEQKTK